MSSKVGATAAEGFAQGPHLKLNLCLETEMLDGSSSMRSHDARAVGVIDIEIGLIVLGQPTELRQWCEVSVHAEQTVGHNQGVSSSASFGQKGLEMAGVVVSINTKVGRA